MSFALGRMGWAPQTVWTATLAELEWAAAAFVHRTTPDPLNAAMLHDLMDRYPDERMKQNAVK